MLQFQGELVRYCSDRAAAKRKKLEPQGAQRTTGERPQGRLKHEPLCETWPRILITGYLRSGDSNQPSAFERISLFFLLFLFLDGHVFQFTGLEHVSTFLTFHIFGFFVARDDLYSRMLAQFGADFFGRGLRRLARRHKLVDYSKLEQVRVFPGNWRHFAADG